MANFKTGQIIPLQYKDREFKGLIIHPNGLGKWQGTAFHQYQLSRDG